MNMFTRLSGKGQVVLPKIARDRQGWGPGIRLEVVDFPGGMILRATSEKSSPENADAIFARLEAIAAPASVAMTDDDALQISIRAAVQRDEATKSD